MNPDKRFLLVVYKQDYKFVHGAEMLGPFDSEADRCQKELDLRCLLRPLSLYRMNVSPDGRMTFERVKK